jgi:hypothetical protein
MSEKKTINKKPATKNVAGKPAAKKPAAKKMVKPKADHKKLNLYEKIQGVANKVMNIEKDLSVGTGNYEYKATSDLAVTLAVKRAETDFRLLSIPINQEIVSSETIKKLDKNNKESFVFVENIKMTLRIIDLDNINHHIEVVSYGKGVDSGDKGFGKASTYARKYALLNAYKIATGEDPDADKSETINTPKTLDERRLALKNYFDKNMGLLEKVLEHFNVEKEEDLTDAQVKLTYQTYKEKKVI